MSASDDRRHHPPVLTVDGLVTAFDTEAGTIRAVEGVGFALHRGETLGLVGESGCGKSVTALSIMRLLPRPAGRIAAGRIRLGDTELTGLPPERMHHVRGHRIGMIFQEPMTALNPVHRVERQLSEVFALHFPDLPDDEVRRRCLTLLERVGIPAPAARLREYPHQLSGGMRQRVMIAMALAGEPEVLIADEPTTALDVTIQAQILSLIAELQRDTGMAVLFITHDMGVIAEVCDTVVVMYAGRVAESAPVNVLFDRPHHPYTRGLLASIPRLELIPKTRLPVIRGMVPGLDELPDGCRFQNRCPYVMPGCQIAPPPLAAVGAGHRVACYLWRSSDGGRPAAAGEGSG